MIGQQYYDRTTPVATRTPAMRPVDSSSRDTVTVMKSLRIVKFLPSSVWGNAGLACAVTFLALASCAGVQERLEMLRAEHIEIIDDKGTVKMDVEKQIRALEERIAKLEAASPHAAAPTPTPTPSASTTADASAPTPNAADADPLAPPRHGPARQAPAQPKGASKTEVF